MLQRASSRPSGVAHLDAAVEPVDDLLGGRGDRHVGVGHVEYDRRLYGRSFLNCYQRQSLVMLAERMPAVPELFLRCLVSTDRILGQVIHEQRAKYHFDRGPMAQADLERIGTALVRRVGTTGCEPVTPSPQYSKPSVLACHELVDAMLRVSFVQVVLDVR